jgi:recombinational DNA repair protein RecT
MIAFRQRIDEMLRHVAEIHPHADVVQMRSALLMEALRTPALMQGSDNDITALLLQAAESGLAIGHELTPMVDADQRTGAVSIVAVEKVKGLIQLMRNAGATDVSCGTVYEADAFQHQWESQERSFTFVPNLSVRRRGAIIAFFAVVDLPHGAWHAKALSVTEVEQLRRASTSPNHRAWRDYFPRMGELCALRATSDWIPQSRRPRGFSAFASPTVDFEPTPMMQMDPNDPYAPAPRRHATAPEPDFEITEEPIFADANAASQERMPGTAQDLDGYGGQPVGRCSDHLLLRTLEWIRKRPDREVRYARLSLAITMVLKARNAWRTTPPSGASV